MNQHFTSLRQFFTRAFTIDFILYRDAWDRYIRRVPKRRLDRPSPKPGSLQDEVDRQMRQTVTL